MTLINPKDQHLNIDLQKFAANCIIKLFKIERISVHKRLLNKSLL